ncbi:MAG: hypothetical protein SOR92_04775 [Christensenella hongkongensis]|nr:hypothetical protein [Christensenella hongkongensis]MDY3003761.1 hypothetical protein [Christensenella hongkongensis]
MLWYRCLAQDDRTLVLIIIAGRCIVMQRYADRTFYRGELTAYGVCPKCRVICKFRSMDQASENEYKCGHCDTPVKVVKLSKA